MSLAELGEFVPLETALLCFSIRYEKPPVVSNRLCMY